MLLKLLYCHDKLLKMFVVSFEWLLELIYKILKYSGFLFITIDFNSLGNFTKSKRFYDKVLFCISLGLSLYANFFRGYLPVQQFTHSHIMEIGVNLMCFSMVLKTFFLKVSNMAHGQVFFDTIDNLKWCNVKVSVTSLIY